MRKSVFLGAMTVAGLAAGMSSVLIFAFEPVFAASFAWTMGGEAVVFHRALGGLFIFLAMIISGLSPDKINFKSIRTMIFKSAK